MSHKNVQIKLRDSVSVESKIMTLLDEAGPRSGLPKQIFIAGYKALYESTSETVTPVSEDATKIEHSQEKQPHAFDSFVVKG